MPKPRRVPKTMERKPRLLPTSEVAARLGVHVRTVHRLVDAGQMEPALRLPGIRGAFLFDAAEVERVARERAA